MKKLLTLIFLASSWTVQAYWAPIDVSIFSPVELPPCNDAVYGLRVNVPYGRTSSMYGIDAGCAQHVRGSAGGIECGACNFVTGRFVGVQVAFGSNFAVKELDGLQVGFYNCCRGESNGLQIGLVNWTYDMSGFQIGLVNFIWNSPLVCFPIVNAHF